MLPKGDRGSYDLYFGPVRRAASDSRPDSARSSEISDAQRQPRPKRRSPSVQTDPLPCAGCGYDLRGTELAARCPE
ncbi:MAG: hypothetical protein ACK559_24350, partial [bacterium]